jgi:V/A-type H+-transporting ATPase subunit F
VKIAVLTDAESAAGYRLAGLEVLVAADGPAAEKMLLRLVQEKDYALIAINEGLLSDPYRIVKHEMRGRDMPVLLPIPSVASALADKVEDTEAYMRRLIADTIGYEIKIVDS